MACTQYTLDQYTALSEAISTGAMDVQYGDKSVKYRSLNDMIRILDLMKRCLFPELVASNNNGRKFASFKKGT
jgi:hypothetical protein